MSRLQTPAWGGRHRIRGGLFDYRLQKPLDLQTEEDFQLLGGHRITGGLYFDYRLAASETIRFTDIYEDFQITLRDSLGTTAQDHKGTLLRLQAAASETIRFTGIYRHLQTFTDICRRQPGDDGTGSEGDYSLITV